MYPSEHFDLCLFQTKPTGKHFFMLCQAGSSVLSAQTQPASPPQQSDSEYFLVSPPVCPLTRLFHSCWLTGASATANKSSVSHCAHHSHISVNACRCLNKAIFFKCYMNGTQLSFINVSLSPILSCHRDVAFLFRVDVPCCHLLHNWAVIDNSGMQAGTGARHTGHNPIKSQIMQNLSSK